MLPMHPLFAASVLLLELGKAAYVLEDDYVTTDFLSNFTLFTVSHNPFKEPPETKPSLIIR